MLSRIRISFGLAVLLALLFVVPSFAGGWAVITLDELPTNVVANEPVTIGFTVLQHGRTPLDGLHPTITANLYKDQEFVVDAEAGDKPGYYTAELTFPKDGEWRWSIQAFTMDQPMPMLTVAPAGGVVASPVVAEVASGVSPLMRVSGLALIVGVVGAMIAFQRRSRPVAVLTMVSLLAGVVLFVVGAGLTSDVQAKSESGAVDPSISQVEYGRQLFIAKGCITCHYNSRAGSPSDYWTIEMGAPNLSTFSASPEIIFMRLKDPSSVKSDTQMPNLDLTKVEIEALVAFINSK